jgi:hypothetical protein
MQYEMKTYGQIISPSKLCQIFGKTLKIKIACDEEITRGLILVNVCYYSVQNFPFSYLRLYRVKYTEIKFCMSFYMGVKFRYLH